MLILILSLRLHRCPKPFDTRKGQGMRGRGKIFKVLMAMAGINQVVPHSIQQELFFCFLTEV